MSMKTHLETRALFAGYNPADNHGAVKPPIHPAAGKAERAQRSAQQTWKQRMV